MKNKIFNIILIFIFCDVFSLLLMQCDGANPTALGPQPTTLKETKHQPLLNVFGVLRPDTLAELPRSFVHLEFVYDAKESPDSTLVTDADVTVVRADSSLSADSVAFIYTELNNLASPEYRNTLFFPKPGIYRLVCRKDGFPELTAETVLPHVPIIRDRHIEINDTQLSFSLIQDENVGLVEVILDGDEWQVRDRFLPPEKGDIPVTLALSPKCLGVCKLSVYAYDLNLSEYLTANMSVKPNVYLEGLRIVNNGFGCFGSLNVLVQKIIL